MRHRYPGVQCEQYFVQLVEAAIALPAHLDRNGEAALPHQPSSSGAVDQPGVGERCATDSLARYD